MADSLSCSPPSTDDVRAERGVEIGEGVPRGERRVDAGVRGVVGITWGIWCNMYGRSRC
jgi:hypothetical protein